MQQSPTFTIGDRLAKARRDAGITSAGMADLLRVSRNTISNYEHDRTEPTSSTLRIYAEHTGVSVDWLLDTERIGRGRRSPRGMTVTRLMTA